MQIYMLNFGACVFAENGCILMRQQNLSKAINYKEKNLYSI